ncbi:MAG: permease-like cell division protein FtsX [bacterium]|nr:permease-like cell division protein FtsX [bacterium]
MTDELNQELTANAGNPQAEQAASPAAKPTDAPAASAESAPSDLPDLAITAEDLAKADDIIIEPLPIPAEIIAENAEDPIITPIVEPQAITESPAFPHAQFKDEPEEPPKKRLTPSGGYYIECFLREVITNIKRNPMMSIASISTVMVLALILGLFIIAIANLEALADELAGEMHIKVYMADSFNPENVNEFKAQANKIEHITRITFVPKDEAFKKLRERLNAKLNLDDLEQNPLPDAFEIPVDNPKFLEAVAYKLAQIEDVATVDYGREEAKKLMTLNHFVRLVGIVILALLFISTILIVSNTIRLTVFARRKEIDIMQLVGAADWFIRWPFILEGVLQGLIGSGLAAVLLDISYRMVVPQLQKSISFLPILEPNVLLPYLIIGLIFMGMLVGALGSLISVNRYLKA